MLADFDTFNPDTEDYMTAFQALQDSSAAKSGGSSYLSDGCQKDLASHGLMIKTPSMLLGSA
jgi:hypothetical protein